MKLRPFFSYFGGKWRAASRLYPPPAHDTIVEPFAGAAGYATRYADRRVVLVDADPIIAGLWRYLVRVSCAEILAIPDVPLDGTVDDIGPLPQEAKWLVGFWVNKGSASPRKRPSAWMRSAVRPHSYWGATVRRIIAGQLDAIRHWTVREGDYTDASVLHGEATWFVDPPYQVAGKSYRFGADRLDYAQIGEWCRSRRGLVIVCENSGASWLPFRDISSEKAGMPGTRSLEAAWVGGA